MEDLIKYIIDLINLDFPWLTDGVVRLISHFIMAAIIAVAAPSSLIVLTWMLRKVIGRIQNRLGPNRAGPFGWFQAVADMIKMFTKEDITPTGADRVAFNIAPGLAVISSIMVFAVIPFAPGFVGADLNVAVLYIVAIGGIGTLGALMAGWASNNKYSLLGAFRAVAVMLTYEIPMVMALVIITLAAGSMSMVKIVEAQSGMWYAISMPLAFLIFFFAGLAEVGSSPVDMLEAESELIAGFHTEYSGMKFGMFMIGEYVHLFAFSFFSAVLFLGGWQFPIFDLDALPAPFGPLIGFATLMVKVFFVVFITMWMRGTLPRFRIDHLLDFAWKFLVPLSLCLLIGVAVVVKLFAPASSLVPGPLNNLGGVGEIVALMLVNLVVAGLTMVIVSVAARRSRNKGLRAVSAVEPIIASK
jgi:NADH-quinone oxidoreductase subunit H